MKQIRISICCDAPVTVEGRVTMFYRCTKCGKPCDAKVGEGGR